MGHYKNTFKIESLNRKRKAQSFEHHIRTIQDIMIAYGQNPIREKKESSK